MRRLLMSPVILILALSAVVQVCFLLSADDFIVTKLLGDDSFYYLKVAQNFSQFHTTTFDGLNTTSGFHPLFQYCLILLASFVHGSMALIRAMMAMNSIAFVASGVPLYFVVKHFLSREASFFAVVLWVLNPMITSFQLLGLENNLVSLILLSVLAWWIRLERKTNVKMWEWFIFGLMLGLAFLARNDELFLVVGVGSWLLYRWFRSRAMFSSAGRSTVTVVLGAGVLIIPYLVFNLVSTGHFMQVSGAVKQFHTEIWRLETFGATSALHPQLLLENARGAFLGFIRILFIIVPSGFWAFFVQLKEGKQLIDEVAPIQYFRVVVGAIMTFGVVLIAMFMRSQRVRLSAYVSRVRVSRLLQEVPFPVRVLWLITTVHFFYYYFFFTEPLGYAYRWYFVPEFLSSVILVAFLADRFLFSMQKFLRALRIGLTVLSAGFFVLLFFPGIGPKSPLIRSVDHLSIATPHPSRSHQVLFVKAAQWSNENIPKNERIGIWAAGIFGYLSDHTTIHLEGLVNDYDFFTNYLSQGRTMEYIRDQDIRYLLVLGGEGNPLYFHTHPVYGIPTDSYDPIYSISEDDGTVLSFLKVRPTD